MNDDQLLNVDDVDDNKVEADDHHPEPPHLAEDPDKNVLSPEPEVSGKVRPDNVPDTFWNQESGEIDIDGLAKAYSDLRGKMANGKHLVPDDGYKIEHIEGVEGDDPLLASFLDLAKEEGLSQGSVESIVKLQVDRNREALQQADHDRDQEIKKLGRNADRIIGSTVDWLSRLSSSGVLAKPEVAAITEASSNAVFVHALDKIRRSYNEPTTIPTVAATTDTPPITMDDIQSLMADSRYGKDMAYTKNVEAQVYALHGETI